MQANLNWSSHYYQTTSVSMPTKATGRGRKRGIQRGIHRLRCSKAIADTHEGEDNETEGSKFLGFSRSKLSTFGKQFFKIKIQSCEKFHLIGFTLTEKGEFVPVNRKQQIWHYLTVFVLLALSIQKTWGTVDMFIHEELRVESFLCLCLALIYNGGVLLALGIVLKPKETMDVYNSWAQISDILKQTDPGCKCHPLDNISACLQVLSSFFVTQGIVTAVALGSVIMDDLPTFLLPTAERYGLLPEGVLPNWAWRLVFAPLEGLMAQPYMLYASFCPDFLFMHTGLLDLFLRTIRKINVRSMRSRGRVEQMYVQLELFNRIGQVWILFFIPPWLITLASTVIVTFFITIRYTELPLIFYVFFPYIGMTLMVLIFWQSYNMYNAIGASEDILEKLWKHEAPYFLRMTRAERIEKMKSSKAMRPLVFSIADSEFSLDLPINTWDEIINQTLFLLSL